MYKSTCLLFILLLLLLLFPFRFDKIARVAGSLATRQGKRIGVGDTTPVGGILIRKGFSHIVVGKEDLGQVANLTATYISQKLSIPTSKTFSQVRFALEQVFMGVNVMNIRKIKEEPDEEEPGERERERERERALIEIDRQTDRLTICIQHCSHSLTCLVSLLVPLVSSPPQRRWLATSTPTTLTTSPTALLHSGSFAG